ncbi:DUF6453 family protein [Yersinia kristensenii]|uniref:DUF6453 family protein n=1 Tax=Yersinia kristensenii TaxID=28152 RepID=UPI00119F6848|nr:DUF6453 family protein [Yersinia kristensenii]
MAEPILYVSPADGGKGVNITSGSRLLKFLGNYDVSGSPARATLSGYTGGSLYLVPTRFGGVFSSGSSSFGWYINGYSLSGNQITFSTSDGGPGWAVFSAFEIPGSPSFGTYGLLLQDSVNYMSITDSSTLGFCVWRGQANISSDWQVPAGIPNRENAVVFANWNNPDVSLNYDNDRKNIHCFQINPNGTTGNGSVVANVCVFTTGFYPQPPSTGTAGLAIFNTAGQCTYSSRYAPLILGKTVQISSTPNSWINTGIQKPMIPLPSLGGFPSGPIMSGNYRGWYRSAMRMSGSNITAGAGAYENSSNTLDYPSGISPLALPVLNADTYF